CTAVTPSARLPDPSQAKIRRLADVATSPGLRRIPVADRIPPLATERPARHLRPGRSLVALPLAAAHQPQHPVDRGDVEARADDLFARLLKIDISATDRIVQVVGRQRSLIALVLA